MSSQYRQSPSGARAATGAAESIGRGAAVSGLAPPPMRSTVPVRAPGGAKQALSPHPARRRQPVGATAPAWRPVPNRPPARSVSMRFARCDMSAATHGQRYDPATAQFLTVDPISPISRAPYSYVGDNPLNYGDPSGLIGLEELGEGIAGWGDALTFGATKWVREELGINNVNTCSTAYQLGGYGALATAVLIPGDAEVAAAEAREALEEAASSLSWLQGLQSRRALRSRQYVSGE
jgi:RHS repeat-associated protein